MSSVVISGDTSGAITLQAPAVSGNTTLTLPTTSGTVVVANGAQTIEFADGSASAPSITNSGDTNTGMFFPAADTIAFAEGGVEAMRLDASGNVGIGTGNPLGKLDLGATTGQKLLTYGFSNTRYGLGVEGNEWRAFATSGAFLSFGHISSSDGVTFTERMRIDSSGNVLIGTTSTTPRDFTSGTGCKIPQSGGPFEFATSDSNVSFINYTATASGAGTFIVFRQQGATRGTISTNGSTTAYNTSSDYRLKENVTPMIGALNVIEQLNPVTYIWKNTGKDGQGFIAHELQSVVPDAVTGEKDAVDDDGNPVYQGVDTSFLVATLTKAIQELKAIVDEQAEKIKALEAK